MLTTMVDNWPGFRDGIMGPDLMTEMRAQVMRFGTEILEGNITAVDVRQRPFTISMGDGRRITAGALVIATGASSRWLGDRLRSQAVRARCVDLRHMRRVLLQGAAHRRGGRRRFGDGGGDLSD